MAQWLGKSRIEKKDIEESIPSITEYFPMLTKYYIDDQKMHINLLLDYDDVEPFKKAVTKAYGSFNPTNVHRAATEALSKWLESHS